MKIYDFTCGSCGHAFEAFVSGVDDRQTCPQCDSSSVARSPVLQMSIRTSNNRRGRLVDLSSNSCPCGCASGRHAHRAAQ